MTKNNSFRHLFILLYIIFVSPLSLYAADKKSELSKGQLIYVPVYSHIYSGNKENPMLLTATLSIRNIDPNHQVRITEVNYYATQGNLLKKYIDTPPILKPLESLRYVISQKDKSGGSGANFMVEWHSDEFVNPPIIESIMISSSPHGVSFTSRGQEIFSLQ